MITTITPHANICNFLFTKTFTLYPLNRQFQSLETEKRAGVMLEILTKRTVKEKKIKQKIY